MTEIVIRDSQGKPYDARVELFGSDIIVHSRSGGGAATRNRDYKEVVTAILSRLAASGRKPTVFLDSRAVQDTPLSQRLIASATELNGDVSDQFNYLVRAMNKGRASHGAWSRILFQVPGEAKDIAGIITSSGRRQKVVRPDPLPASEQRRVTTDHIDAAIASLQAGNDTILLAPSKDYDVITPGGDLLAPKKVFGRALELAGVVDLASPYHFKAGWSQPCFQIIEASGYDIIRKADAHAEVLFRRRRAARSRKEVEEEIATVGVDAEERSWIEGDKRMASHLRVERKRSTKAANAKRAQVRAANDGRLACDRCSTDWYATYGEKIAEAIFDVHHTIPLKDMDEGHETKVEDLLCLCANCHRAEHRQLVLQTSGA